MAFVDCEHRNRLGTEKAATFILLQSLKSFEMNVIHLFKQYCFPRKNKKSEKINHKYNKPGPAQVGAISKAQK